MKILITGGTGFIGSHVFDSLQCPKVTSIRILDNMEAGSFGNLKNNPDYLGIVEVWNYDIREYANCVAACEGMDVVIHLAARGSVPKSFADPSGTLDVNTQGTTNIFAAAKQAGVKHVIYASSSSVYGSPPTPWRENQKVQPVSPYGLSKRFNEMTADMFASAYQMSFIGLRFFNVFGPRQSVDKGAVIPSFMLAAKSGFRPTIYGLGNQVRDFTYVDNVVHAINLAVFSIPRFGVNQVYNVGCGQGTSVNMLWGKIAELASSNKRARRGTPRPSEVASSVAAMELIREELDFHPFVSLEDGLKKTWEYFRDEN